MLPQENWGWIHPSPLCDLGVGVPTALSPWPVFLPLSPSWEGMPGERGTGAKTCSRNHVSRRKFGECGMLCDLANGRLCAEGSAGAGSVQKGLQEHSHTHLCVVCVRFPAAELILSMAVTV